MQALDVRNHGLVFHDGRGFVGNVDPYEVIAFQTGGFERFVGLDGCTARAAPGIPEVHEHHFAFVGRDEGVEQPFFGHVGRGFHLRLGFHCGQFVFGLLLHEGERFEVERVVHGFHLGKVRIGERDILRLGRVTGDLAQVLYQSFLDTGQLRPVERR